MMTDLITAKKFELQGILYNQCCLRKGNITQISFIPKKFATAGKVVKLKTDGVWDDGWVVESVGTEVDEAVLNALRSAGKHHRDVSDI